MALDDLIGPPHSGNSRRANVTIYRSRKRPRREQTFEFHVCLSMSVRSLAARFRPNSPSLPPPSPGLVGERRREDSRGAPIAEAVEGVLRAVARRPCPGRRSRTPLWSNESDAVYPRANSITELSTPIYRGRRDRRRARSRALLCAARARRSIVSLPSRCATLDGPASRYSRCVLSPLLFLVTAREVAPGRKFTLLE